MNTPKHKLGIAMLHMAEQGKRPCFRIDGLRITIALEGSVNPGSLYIKDDNWDYIGKVSPDGFMKIMHPSKITAEQKMTVMAAIHDPEHTAMTNGKVTGTCCCCGRQLTNPLSIELGIGPICRGFWFPESMVITKATIEELTSSLELDLGLPPVTPEEVKEAVEHLASLPTPLSPVDSLILNFRELNSDQKVSFITTVILEAVNSNASN